MRHRRRIRRRSRGARKSKHSMLKWLIGGGLVALVIWKRKMIMEKVPFLAKVFGHHTDATTTAKK